MTAHPSDGGAAAGRITLELMRLAYDRLQDYYRWADKKFSGSQNEMGVEAYSRLKQTIRLVELIVGFLEEAGGLPQPPAHQSHEEWQDWVSSPVYAAKVRAIYKNMDDIQLFTDCAYLIAWRASGAIRQLDGLSSFKPKGVRDVRNKLIEHVDGKDSGVLINSFAMGAECGPVVRAMRTSDKADLWPDAGLFVNMTEYSNDLTRFIDKVLENERVPPASP